MSSDLVVLETLVKPLQDADTAVERLFRELFDADEVMLIPTTRQLWEEAASLRADEEVSLTARGVRLHGPDGIGGERPDCGFIAAGRSIWETFACSRSG